MLEKGERIIAAWSSGSENTQYAMSEMGKLFIRVFGNPWICVPIPIKKGD